MVSFDGYGGCSDCQRYNPSHLQWKFLQSTQEVYRLIDEARERGAGIRQVLAGNEAWFGVE
jgi:hypothetical protein